MTFREFLDRSERSTYAITVYASSPQPEVVDQFETRTVSVTYAPLPPVSRDEGFLVVRDADGFVASIGLAEAREFLEPPILRPWDDAFVDASYRPLLEILDTTLWHSLSRRQLLATSREIEDRAWRVGSGTLRVGFQRLSMLDGQLSLYERLAAETELEIHVYGVADEIPPVRAGITVHAVGGDAVSAGGGDADDGNGDSDGDGDRDDDGDTDSDDGGDGDSDSDADENDDSEANGDSSDGDREDTDDVERGEIDEIDLEVADGAADDEIGSFWFLAFDGGDDDRQACALLAEERAFGEFVGFWTYDASFVGEINSYVRETYG